MEKTAVLFDVGAVLLELNYSGLYEEGARLTGMTPEQFKEKYNESGLELGVFNGEISHEDYQSRLKQMLGNPNITREQLEDFVSRGWGTEIRDIVDLKERVYFQGNCPVNIFSNINQFAFEYLSRTYPRMFQTFNPEAVPICSYTSRGVKPKPMMYQDAQLWTINTGCDKVILIEDKPSYLQLGVEKFGWNGIFFTPYVDPNETIRSVAGHNDKVKPSDKIFTANSVQELEEGLRFFGVKV